MTRGERVNVMASESQWASGWAHDSRNTMTSVAHDGTLHLRPSPPQGLQHQGLGYIEQEELSPSRVAHPSLRRCHRSHSAG